MIVQGQSINRTQETQTLENTPFFSGKISPKTQTQNFSFSIPVDPQSFQQTSNSYLDKLAMQALVTASKQVVEGTRAGRSKNK
jgi:hypothetical protein